jgi:TRAP-type C4-dicarboxylate transport system substrate-binding protein
MIGGLAAAAVSVATRGRAQTPVQIRISTAAPPSDFLTKALGQLKSDIDQTAVGLDVSVHPASTLFKQGTEVPALQRGNLEMSTMTSFEIAQQIPELGYFNRGYLLGDYAQLRRVFDGAIGGDFRKTVADKMGIEIIATHYLGTRQVNLRQKRDVKGPADLAGVKMRMPAGPEWAHARRDGGTARHAGSLSRFEDRHGGRAGEPVVDPQRGEILRSHRSRRADRAYGPAGLFRHGKAGLGRA